MSVSAFTFVPFPTLNDQHVSKYDELAQNMFTGEAFAVLGQPIEKDKETLKAELLAKEARE